MGAIFRREFKSFFTNPIGYVVLAVMYCLSGYFFFHYNLYSDEKRVPKLQELFCCTCLLYIVGYKCIVGTRLAKIVTLNVVRTHLTDFI